MNPHIIYKSSVHRVIYERVFPVVCKYFIFPPLNIITSINAHVNPIKYLKVNSNKPINLREPRSYLCTFLKILPIYIKLLKLIDRSPYVDIEFDQRYNLLVHSSKQGESTDDSLSVIMYNEWANQVNSYISEIGDCLKLTSSINQYLLMNVLNIYTSTPWNRICSTLLSRHLYFKPVMQLRHHVDKSHTLSAYPASTVLLLLTGDQVDRGNCLLYQDILHTLFQALSKVEVISAGIYSYLTKGDESSIRLPISPELLDKRKPSVTRDNFLYGRKYGTSNMSYFQLLATIPDGNIRLQLWNSLNDRLNQADSMEDFDFSQNLHEILRLREDIARGIGYIDWLDFQLSSLSVIQSQSLNNENNNSSSFVINESKSIAKQTREYFYKIIDESYDKTIRRLIVPTMLNHFFDLLDGNRNFFSHLTSNPIFKQVSMQSDAFLFYNKFNYSSIFEKQHIQSSSHLQDIFYELINVSSKLFSVEMIELTGTQFMPVLQGFKPHTKCFKVIGHRRNSGNMNINNVQYIYIDVTECDVPNHYILKQGHVYLHVPLEGLVFFNDYGASPHVLLTILTRQIGYGLWLLTQDFPNGMTDYANVPTDITEIAPNFLEYFFRSNVNFLQKVFKIDRKTAISWQPNEIELLRMICELNAVCRIHDSSEFQANNSTSRDAIRYFRNAYAMKYPFTVPSDAEFSMMGMGTMGLFARQTSQIISTCYGNFLAMIRSANLIEKFNLKSIENFNEDCEIFSQFQSRFFHQFLNRKFPLHVLENLLYNVDIRQIDRLGVSSKDIDKNWNRSVIKVFHPFTPILLDGDTMRVLDDNDTDDDLFKNHTVNRLIDIHTFGDRS